MKKLILCALLILGWVGTVQASDVEFWTPKPGDEVFRVFGTKKGKEFCQLNLELSRLGKDCKVVAGKEYTLPAGVSLHSKQAEHKTAAVPTALPLTTRLQASTEYLGGIFLWERVGGAPLRGCGKQDVATVNEKAWNMLIKQGLLTEAERDELRVLTRGMTEPKIGHADDGTVQLLRGMRLESLTFCKDGQPVVKTNVKTAWDDSQAVYAQEFTLKSGKRALWVRNCLNWGTRPPLPRAPVPVLPPVVSVPPTAASAPPPAASAPPAVVTPPVVVDKVASDYDWDAGLFVGGDKDVRFAGGDGAGYPLIRYYDWGRYALGGGGGFSLWHGGTPDGYRYSGETAAFGLAQKFSFNNRRDLGIKFPMYGDLWTRGHDKSGSYQQKTHASMLCASASYTDASREKEGKTVAPEWQIWASFCDPFSQKKSHSYNGKALDASTIQDVKYVAGVGGRVFLSKNLGDTGLLAKVQPFAEIGVNQTAPNPISAHAYVGLRTVDKVWGCGVGIHHAETGNLPGATCTYDLGRDVKLRQQKERWDAMIKSIEALGVAVD